jgi:hypothetical protein
LHDASLDRIFSEALHVSPDRSRGTSFEAVIESAMRVHSADIASLGWRVVALKNSVAQCKQRLRLGAPVVAGYQVNESIARFHGDPDACEAHGYLLPPFSAATRAASAHAVLILGFDDAVGCFIARNSWGETWGVGGHFLIRFRDVEDSSFFTDIVSFALLSESIGPSDARTS